jgi:hypothetical protein
VSRAADAAIVGDEAEVAREISRLSELGVTDLTAVPFDVAGDRAAPERTQAFLAGLARAGVG